MGYAAFDKWLVLGCALSLAGCTSMWNANVRARGGVATSGAEASVATSTPRVGGEVGTGGQVDVGMPGSAQASADGNALMGIAVAGAAIADGIDASSNASAGGRGGSVDATGGSSGGASGSGGASVDARSNASGGASGSSSSSSSSGSGSGSIAASGTSASGTASGTASGASASGTGAIRGFGTATTAEIEMEANDAIAISRLTGGGSRLRSLIVEGVTIDGEIAALARLGAVGYAPSAERSVFAHDASFRASASLVHEALPFEGGATQVVVRVEGAPATSAVRDPLRVHLVVDASTSMESSWAALQNAAIALVAQLAPEDELHIVTYSDEAHTVLGPMRIGDGRSARLAIRRLTPGGGTHIESGLRAAYGACNSRSLVVLLSDGAPNGGLSEPDELAALSAGARDRSGAITTVIGLGHDYDYEVLRAVAAEGRGSFRIAPRPEDFEGALRAELAAQGYTAATDVAIDLDLGPGVRIDGALDLGIEATEHGARIALPRLGAGETRTFVVPITVPRRRDAREVVTAKASWSSAFTAHGETRLGLSIDAGAEAVVSSEGSARLVAADRDLSTALRLAGRAIAVGDGATAAAALRAHVTHAEVALGDHANVRLRARTDAVTALASAVSSLTARASWNDRREVGAAFSARALLLAR